MVGCAFESGYVADCEPAVVVLVLVLVLAGTTAIGAVQCMITYRVGWQKHCQELGYVDDRHGASVSVDQTTDNTSQQFCP